MEHIITYVRPIPFFKKLFGTLVILFSVYAVFYQSMIIGFFMLAFGIYLSSSEGSQIDLDRKTYRNIWSIFAIHFGKWEPLPDYEYISLFKGKQKQRVNGAGAGTTLTDQVYLINLFYQRNKHTTFYRSFDKDDALKVAKHFRMALGLDILDATERDQRWLKAED